jgi:hypothetical protein
MTKNTIKSSLFAAGFFIGFFITLIILLSINSIEIERFKVNTQIKILGADCLEIEDYHYHCKNITAEEVNKIFKNRNYKILDAQKGNIRIKLENNLEE